MRPNNIDEFLGQDEPVKFLKSLLVQGVHIPSLILWGPCGCGKTTFVRLICKVRNDDYTCVSVSAVNTGGPELKKLMEKAKQDKRSWNKSTIIFIDEIHRLNKAQQDILLPFMEDGSCTLIGCTTENPSFEINTAVLSRSKVIVFHKLNDDEILAVLQQSLNDKRGFEGKFTIETEILKKIASIADGDCRVAFNILEMCVSIAEDGVVNHNLLSSVLQRTHSSYDKDALHKSMRGGDANASIYWSTHQS